LDKIGILPATKKVHHNLSYTEIAEHERKNNEGQFTANGTFVVDTGTATEPARSFAMLHCIRTLCVCACSLLWHQARNLAVVLFFVVELF
jgi:hypothetical protein